MAALPTSTASLRKGSTKEPTAKHKLNDFAVQIVQAIDAAPMFPARANPLLCKGAPGREREGLLAKGAPRQRPRPTGRFLLDSEWRLRRPCSPLDGANRRMAARRQGRAEHRDRELGTK